MKLLMSYIQLGIATVLITSTIVGIAKAMWVLSGTSYNHTYLLIAQIVQGALLAIPLGMAKSSIDQIRKQYYK